MGEIARQISSKRTEISLLQATVIALQKQCGQTGGHTPKFHSQELLGEAYQTMLKCEECGIEQKTNGPYCEKHGLKMIVANDHIALAAKQAEESKVQNAYWSYTQLKCPACDFRLLTRFWDK